MSKNTHLEHLEDSLLMDGKQGALDALTFLDDLCSMFVGQPDQNASVTVKWDGSPAIFCGKYPGSDRIFVATKSVFNKDAKINYSKDDVKRNHGHAAGLVEKLNSCLEYIPRLNPQGVYQGDLLFTDDAKEGYIDGKKCIIFTPNKITSASLGYSPWAESNSKQIDWGNQLMLVLGTEFGKINGYEFDVNTNETPSKQTKMKFNDNEIFEGSINGLLLGDYNDGGYNDLFVLDSLNLRMFSTSSMVEYYNASIDSNRESIITIGYPSKEGTYSKLILDDGSNWYSEEITENTISTSERINIAAGLIGFFLAAILMVLLYKWPEWYVVNTVGICVGSGVVVLLGISFVPWLIIFFMIAAAIYDAWAVYKSKHMLELADTMINLKLPILLVAPQDKGYSFIEDNPSEMRAQPDVESKIPKKAKPVKKKGAEKDAMFMGLGDVIFPGMLVISAMTWLPAGNGLLGISAPMMVALGTLIGGLLGYFVLMGFVALGRPQAGLPLLNGGSILGYMVSAAIFIGSKAFELNITF